MKQILNLVRLTESLFGLYKRIEQFFKDIIYNRHCLSRISLPEILSPKLKEVGKFAGYVFWKHLAFVVSIARVIRAAIIAVSRLFLVFLIVNPKHRRT